MRHPFPPKSSGSSPAFMAMACTRRLESADDHADVPSAPTKRGVPLARPNVRSSGGMFCFRSSHVIHSASNAHSGSAPRCPPRWRRRSGIG
eukprot:5519632-Pleurochrysis_carterae.AAC.2